MSRASRRVSEILEVLAGVQNANPRSPQAILTARQASIHKVAERRGINGRTVLDKCYRQIGLSSVRDFDSLIEGWLLRADSSLEQRIRQRSSVRAGVADAYAITSFFASERRGVIASQSNASGRDVVGFLRPFKPKADVHYVRYVRGGLRVASRNHESLVNGFAQWLVARGLKPGRNRAIDLGIEHPPVVIEGEYVVSWPRSVREAVGQLYEYRFFQVVRPDAKLVFLASKPVPRKWRRYLEQDRQIAVAWKEANTFVLSDMASSIFGLTNSGRQ